MHMKVGVVPTIRHLVKKTKHLSSDVLPPGLLVVENTSGCSENYVAKLTRWQKLDDPFLEITELNIVAGADDTSFVNASPTKLAYSLHVGKSVTHVS